MLVLLLISSILVTFITFKSTLTATLFISYPKTLHKHISAKETTFPLDDIHCTGLNESSDSILYLRSISRTGNVMFEYASLFGIAKHHGRRAVMTGKDGNWMKELFSSLSIPLQQFMHTGLQGVGERQPNTFEPKLYNLPNKKALKVGTWLGNYKYFIDYECALRKEFQIHPDMQKKVNEQLEMLTEEWLKNKKLDKKPAKMTYIGVHVRRGDKALDGPWTVPEVSYFNKSAAYFRSRYPNTIFVVTSDGMDWSRKNLKSPDFVFAHNSPHMDMALLGSCNHTLMSVGTFSWWAAWLANGTTVYFKDHVNPKSILYGMFQDNYYFLPQWIPMTN